MPLKVRRCRRGQRSVAEGPVEERVDAAQPACCCRASPRTTGPRRSRWSRRRSSGPRQAAGRRLSRRSRPAAWAGSLLPVPFPPPVLGAVQEPHAKGEVVVLAEVLTAREQGPVVAPELCGAVREREQAIASDEALGPWGAAGQGWGPAAAGRSRAWAVRARRRGSAARGPARCTWSPGGRPHSRPGRQTQCSPGSARGSGRRLRPPPLCTQAPSSATGPDCPGVLGPHGGIR